MHGSNEFKCLQGNFKTGSRCCFHFDYHLPGRTCKAGGTIIRLLWCFSNWGKCRLPRFGLFFQTFVIVVSLKKIYSCFRKVYPYSIPSKRSIICFLSFVFYFYQNITGILNDPVNRKIYHS